MLLLLLIKVIKLVHLRSLLVVKNTTANAGRHKRLGSDPWVRKIPWRRAWQSTQYSCLEKPLRQRSLRGYSPQGHKDLLQLSTHAQVKNNVNICLTLSIKTHIGWNLSMKSDFPRTNKLCLIGLFETHYVTETQCWNTVWIS